MRMRGRPTADLGRRPHPSRRVRFAGAVVALALPALGAALPAACKGTPGVELVLADAAGLRKTAAFAEILVYEQGCPGLDVLSRGIEGSPTLRQVVAAGADLPELGELPQGSYGIAALLRDRHCAVLASGCATADLSSVRKVTIPLAAVTPPQGGCAGSAACVGGACIGGGDSGIQDAGSDGAVPDAAALDAAVPDAAAPDAAAPDGGGSCTLAVVKAGALPALAVPGGGTITGPGLAAVADGFLLAYREGTVDQSASSAALVKIGDDGKLGTVSRQALPTCPATTATDGVGVAESNGAGLVVVSRPACPDAGAGLALLTFDAKSQLGLASASADLGAAVSLPRVHALAGYKGGFEAAFVVDGVASLATIVAGALSAKPLFADGTSSYAQVGRTAATRATLADRSTALGGETVLTLSALGVPVGDAGVPAPLGAYRPESAWGSLAAWAGPSGDRALAVTAEPNGWISWGAVDRDGTLRGAGSALSGDGSAFAAGDVAVLDDRVLLALAEPGALRIQKLAGALGDGLSADGSRVDFVGAVGATSLATFDGARVAVAAARNRVLIVWLTRSALGPIDPTGGYAVLACGD